MLGLSKQRGDTLIEVIFAFTVFSLTVVGAMAVMNQGAAASQRSLETTLVRQEIDSQAAALRFMHDSYVAAYQSNGEYDESSPAGQWNAMVAHIETAGVMSASSFSDLTNCPTPPADSFIIDAHRAVFVPPGTDALQPATTFAQVIYDDATGLLSRSEGIWIEAVRSGSSPDPSQQNTGFIDFHVRACWDAPGQSVPATIGTIVRLYEPRG